MSQRVRRAAYPGRGLAVAAISALLLALPAAAGGTSDDLAWLEEAGGARALAWAGEHDRSSRERLLALPLRARIQQQLEQRTTDQTGLADIALVGARALRLQRDAGHPWGILQVAARDARGRPGRWRDVLDVATLRAAEATPYELQWERPAEACLPPRYNRCLLRLSPGGGDQVELREFDLATGRFVPDGFRTRASFAQAAWLDAGQLVIIHTVEAGPRTIAGLGARAWLWQRGQPLAAARPVFEAQPGDAELRLTSIGSGRDRRVVIVRAIDYSNFEILLVAGDGSVTRIDLPRRLKPPGVLATTARHLVLQLSAPARLEGQHLPAETVFACEAVGSRQRRCPILYQPAAGEFISDPFSGIAAGRRRVHLAVSESLRPRWISASPGRHGWSIRTIRALAAGQSIRFSSTDPLAEDVVARISGFLDPAQLILHRWPWQSLTLGREAPAFAASDWQVEIRSASSRDGTRVAYYFVRPRRAGGGDARPVLMTGYGAFGLSVIPGYLDDFVGGRALVAWFERGGALAIPLIRGGGERGAAWHHAAQREWRQRSYDDFIAVAEDLVGSGITTPARLGVFGASNGGLLAAVVAIQRPDLFGAAVIDVPLADMLRFAELGVGSLWIDEYGDPEDPRLAPVLRSYSPVHNVVAGRRYPPFFISTSTQDNRVGPGHARKLAARLLAAGATVYFIEEGAGGHGVSDALTHPQLMAMRMAFLVSQLIERPASAGR